MARSARNADTLTFRLDPQLKAALAEKAHAESKPIGEVVRELVREFVEQEHRRKFAAEAHRQSSECAKRTADPSSEEAAVMREIEDNLRYFGEEWQ